ncbi:hypothetical protein FMM80_18475 [Schaedlerella arabinosiphila]|uniref:MobA/VirD2-like nuclease domain-containing protein n=1 Tax=Schaedlerella arabinosiphila TaxID=2044587 RepID=A0A9X5CF53_9FIRM|nr:hypothetical protein [Schaedlerella arabinosiphila]NDO70521.1 hypothetical protein [Schaedlerella arabinosiphila]
MENIIFKNINKEYCNTDAINNVISYIYRTNNKSPLPIYCYGSIEWPPTYDTLIKEYHLIREISQAELSDQQIIHFIISFDIPVQNVTIKHFYFADDIAKLFRNKYQICYSCHTDNGHPHFHYAVSTNSYIDGNPFLNNEQMSCYESQICSLASTYGFEFYSEGVVENV